MSEVKLPKLIHKDLLQEHPRNSNKQSKHTFQELRRSIAENGMDENLIVTPKEDGSGYYIVSGNHRYRAAVAEGIEELPCVVHDDWDPVKEQVELVRRNYVRGSLDKDTFTVAVDTIAEDHALSLDTIRAEMGFEDNEKFLDFYKQERKQQNKAQRQPSENAAKVKMIDDLGMVLSGILEQYGDTVDKSFIVFPAGGRNHSYIAATPALRRVLTEIFEKCVAEHLDVNLVLGGLLVVGLEHSYMRKGNTTSEELAEKGTEEGDDNF